MHVMHACDMCSYDFQLYSNMHSYVYNKLVEGRIGVRSIGQKSMVYTSQHAIEFIVTKESACMHACLIWEMPICVNTRCMMMSAKM